MAEAQPPQDDPAAAAAAAAQGAPTPSQPAAAAPSAETGAVVDPALAAAMGGAGAATEQAALDQFSIDELLKQASFDDPTRQPDGQSGDSAAAAALAAAEFKLPSFQQVMQDAQVSSIELLRDVEL